MNEPTISIITPSYNQGRFIRDTIESVAIQHNPLIEHIIIDGGSTDNTLEILKEYPHVRWISEKDRGQAHAINKGLAMAKGEIVAWLNSDDYYERGALEKVCHYFNTHNDCMFLYGDITYVDEMKGFLRKFSGDEISFNALLKNPDIVRQPSSFWRKEISLKIGIIDESLHLVMDYEYFLRITKNYLPQYLPENLSYFRTYVTNKTRSNARLQTREIYSVLTRYQSSLNVHQAWFLFIRFIDFYQAWPYLLLRKVKRFIAGLMK